MQTDGGLIQYIEDAGGAVTHGASKLHPLPLAGGECGCGSIKGQVAESQVHQPLCGALKGFTDTLGHGTHFFRQTLGDAFYPDDQLRECHSAGFVQRNTLQLRRTGSSRQACAMTIRTNIFFEKLFYPFHAFFILDLGKGIFYGVDGIKIGEIQFCKVVGVRFFRTVKNVLFHSRTVEYDLLFLFCQLPKRNIRAHTHFPANVCHQGPHQAVPGGNSSFVDRQRVIRHQRIRIHSADDPGAAASLTGSLGIKGQLFCRRCIEMCAAFRTDKLFSCGDSQRRRKEMSIRTAVAGKTGIHQAQTVEQLRSCAEGTADTRHTGALMQSQCSGNIQDFIHTGPGGLGHAAAGMGGGGFEIAPGALSVEHTQCKG